MLAVKTFFLNVEEPNGSIIKLSHFTKKLNLLNAFTEVALHTWKNYESE